MANTKLKKKPGKAAKPAKKKAQALPGTKKQAAAAYAERQSKSPTEKLAAFQAVMDSVNAKVKKSDPTRGPLIMMANSANCSYMLRRPTGVLSLDIAMAGGFPASAPSVIVGPEGIGKDYLLWHTCGIVQKLYGEDFAMAAMLTEFKADKGQMRFAGFKVGYSTEEIEEIAESRARLGQDPLTQEEIDDLRDQIGNIALISGSTAEEGFDALTDYLQANVCQIIAVNSLGSLQTEAKEAKDSFEEAPQQSSEAQLLSKVAPKFSMTMNRLGTKNETAILLVNQVRKRRDMPRVMPGRVRQKKDTYQPAAQSMSLRHGIAIEASLHEGSAIYDEVEKVYLGREVQWELSKGKLGTHDGIKGKYKYTYADGIDTTDDVVATGLRYGVLVQAGSSYTYRHAQGSDFDFNIRGIENVRYEFRTNPELVDLVRQDCLTAAGVNFRHR